MSVRQEQRLEHSHTSLNSNENLRNHTFGQTVFIDSPEWELANKFLFHPCSFVHGMFRGAWRAVFPWLFYLLELVKVSLHVIFLSSPLNTPASPLCVFVRHLPPNVVRDLWPALIPAQGPKGKSKVGKEVEGWRKAEILIGWGVLFYR